MVLTPSLPPFLISPQQPEAKSPFPAMSDPPILPPPGKTFHASEKWPRTSEDTFNLPPLETSLPPTKQNWRGVSLSDVAKQLYYELDNIDWSRDFQGNICAATGEPPQLTPLAQRNLDKNFGEVRWTNMTAVSVMCRIVMLGITMKDAYAQDVVLQGLTNKVLIEDARVDAFFVPDFSEIVNDRTRNDKDEIDDDMSTLTLAVSYTHQKMKSDGLLKADDYQLAQLEDILTAIRNDPPYGTKFVRLWTDQAVSARLARTAARPSWILYGLLPYAVYPVAYLQSRDELDKMSMWSVCEQILSNGGSGCLFSIREGAKFPPFACREYNGTLTSTAVKTVGEGLSINRNLTKLSGAIHSGLLDHTITYHIVDAQLLIRLAYYMVRPDKNVSLDHAVQCDPCLKATFREHAGFICAFHNCADVWGGTGDADNMKRINKMNVYYPYPKVRARRGYVDWHGLREFVPGAGRFAKFIFAELNKSYQEHMHVGRIFRKGELLTGSALAISAFPVPDNSGLVRYLVLFVNGINLYQPNCQVEYSMRLNIPHVDKFHDFMSSGQQNGGLSDYFSHPSLEGEISEMEIDGIIPLSAVYWGRSTKEEDSFKCNVM